MAEGDRRSGSPVSGSTTHVRTRRTGERRLEATRALDDAPTSAERIAPTAAKNVSQSRSPSAPIFSSDQRNTAASSPAPVSRERSDGCDASSSDSGPPSSVGGGKSGGCDCGGCAAIVGGAAVACRRAVALLPRGVSARGSSDLGGATSAVAALSAHRHTSRHLIYLVQREREEAWTYK